LSRALVFQLNILPALAGHLYIGLRSIKPRAMSGELWAKYNSIQPAAQSSTLLLSTRVRRNNRCHENLKPASKHFL